MDLHSKHFWQWPVTHKMFCCPLPKARAVKGEHALSAKKVCRSSSVCVPLLADNLLPLKITPVSARPCEPVYVYVKIIWICQISEFMIPGLTSDGKPLPPLQTPQSKASTGIKVISVIAVSFVYILLQCVTWPKVTLVFKPQNHWV